MQRSAVVEGLTAVAAPFLCVDAVKDGRRSTAVRLRARMPRIEEGVHVGLGFVADDGGVDKEVKRMYW